MKDIDRLIDEALDAEERALLHSIGDEPGYFEQIMGIFAGRFGWVSLILIIVQGAAFVAGAWAAWRFFAADQVLDALRWGLPAAVLLLMSLMIKMALWPQIHTNRLMRELKRIELQVARGAKPQ
ncbi:MAG: DUF6768 family protein [Sphingomonas sp.]|jgi:hypothetical protein|uniref:DUF6768 family protein n=1 Tax=Sphingomonas sp. TaxID=28214 RepID=UPI0035665208